MTMTFAVWWIPLLITMCSIGYALFIYDDGGGYFNGIGNIFMLIPALIISMVSWIVYAIFK